MFRMRPEHVAAFEQLAVEDFVDRAAAHLRESFPETTKKLDDAALRASIQQGIARAAAYQLEEEFDVCLFLDVMTELGRDFDKETKHAWAVVLLTNAEEEPSDRIEQLWERVFEPDTDEEDEEED